MNVVQEEIIRELTKKSVELGHSPTKSEVYSLAMRCYTHFRSFNEAKLKAGLQVKNIKQIVFPENAFILDNDLAMIASYLTFDGHLYKNLSGFMFSSKNIKDIEDFEKIIKRKFNLPSKYHLNSAGSNNQTHKIFFFNKIISKKLFELGIPKGDKVIQRFKVPDWITSSKEFSRDYLKIAYLCEGCNKEEASRKNPRIQINMAKTEEFLGDGIKFMEQLRSMLSKFEIRTTDCHSYGHRIRKKDNKMARDIKFRVITGDNSKFMQEIGWLK